MFTVLFSCFYNKAGRFALAHSWGMLSIMVGKVWQWEWLHSHCSASMKQCPLHLGGLGSREMRLEPETNITLNAYPSTLLP